MSTAGISRRAAVVGAAAALAAGGVGGWRWWSRPGEAAAPQPATGVRTVPVVRTNLAAREQVGGTLGYAEQWQIVHPGPAGVLTAAPAPGTVVVRGQSLYEVDGHPVRLLYGARPAWRALGTGIPSGPDVRQLEANLAALGHFHSTVDGRFRATTAAAVRRWQAKLGVPRTGRLELGDIVFAPGPVRVTGTPAPVGGHVGGGPVIAASSTRRVVTIDLPTSRQGNVRVGGRVLVTPPGGGPLPATVTAVGRVAVPAPAQPGAAPAQPGQPGGPATITVTATLDQAGATGGLDQVPVQVSVTTGERRGVLAVPVTALVAGEAGGYQVVVTDGLTRQRVAVRPGLYDELSGLVEVTGTGLAEGRQVEVPLR
jgi:peptidoglycan hydrolase-like protein with peptidoglycan-binding domain